MFYLLSYNLTTTSQAGLLLGQNSKLTSLIYNDFPLIINYLPVLKFIFIFQVLAAAGFPIFNVVVIKFYLNCIGGMNNSYLVLPLIITQTSLAAAQSYLRIIKLMSKSKLATQVGIMNKGLQRELLCQPTPINFNYWQGIGVLVLFLVVNQLISGVVLASYYIISIDLAFSSLHYVIREVNQG